VNVKRVILGVVLAVVGLNAAMADDTQPADPFDGLVAATSALADMAQQLRPASSNVTVKQEAVQRKQAELAEAEAAEVTAKAEFNEVLTEFLKAIELLKEAALKIQPIVEPAPVL
jgi:hypothetical protein